MRLRLGLRLLVALVPGSVACAADDAGEDGTPAADAAAPVALGPGEWYEASGRQQCRRTHACRDAAPDGVAARFEDYFGRDPDDCAARSLAAGSFSPAELDASVAAGRITYDDATGAACLVAIDASTCEEIWSVSYQLPACAATLLGTVAVGGRCTIHPDCQVVDGYAYLCSDGGRCE